MIRIRLLLAWRLRLNESPSEKEGKFNTEGMLRGDFEASMKALPKRKGNVVVFAPPAFWKLTASMKALPKRKGNTTDKANIQNMNPKPQ